MFAKLSQWEVRQRKPYATADLQFAWDETIKEASPEVGWDFGSNPARLLAVSQAEPLPGQHPALSSEHHQHQPPAPPGLPPVV